jgi:hypothetical protein
VTGSAERKPAETNTAETNPVELNPVELNTRETKTVKTDRPEIRQTLRARFKLAVVTWLAVYPLVTLLLWALGPFVQNLPLPVVTLILSLVLVSLLTGVVMPAMLRLFRPWLQR